MFNNPESPNTETKPRAAIKTGIQSGTAESPRIVFRNKKFLFAQKKAAGNPIIKAITVLPLASFKVKKVNFRIFLNPYFPFTEKELNESSIKKPENNAVKRGIKKQRKTADVRIKLKEVIIYLAEFLCLILNNSVILYSEITGKIFSITSSSFDAS